MNKEAVKFIEEQREKICRTEEKIKSLFPVQADRITLRKYRLSDIFEFWRCISNNELYKYMNCNRMKEFDEAQAYVMSSIRNYNEPWITRLVIADRHSNILLGVISIYVKVYSNNQIVHEIGYWVGSHNAGKGIGTEAVQLVTSIVNQAEFPIYLDILDGNRASIRIAEKTGYKKVGYSSILGHKGEHIKVGKYKFNGGI